MKVVERFEDMSPNGKLRLYQQPDGDIIVGIIPDPDQEDYTKLFPSVEFCNTCMGGGQSPHVLQALRNLINAIELDNKEKPQHREK